MTQDTWTEISADDKPARVKHTPGPWTPDNSAFCECVYAKDSLGADRRICEMIGPHQKANSKLIAAAPTMLAVLHQVSRHFAIMAAHGTPVDVTLEDAVHEAIDAAGGY